MVYGGISIRGSTDLYFIRNGTLTVQMYADMLLKSHVTPYAAAIVNSFLLMSGQHNLLT